jgi:hypothetical protein
MLTVPTLAYRMIKEALLIANALFAAAAAHQIDSCTASSCVIFFTFWNSSLNDGVVFHCWYASMMLFLIHGINVSSYFNKARMGLH